MGIFDIIAAGSFNNGLTFTLCDFSYDKNEEWYKIGRSKEFFLNIIQ